MRKVILGVVIACIALSGCKKERKGHLGPEGKVQVLGYSSGGHFIVY